MADHDASRQPIEILPRIVLTGTTTGGVLIVVGDSLPSAAAAGITILMQRPCEVVLSNSRVG